MTDDFSKKYSEMWNDIYKEQKGKCFICGGDKPDKIDVDWSEGLVFGMNCFDCYCLLSSSNEDPARLKAVIKYLKFKDKVYAESTETDEEKPA